MSSLALCAAQPVVIKLPANSTEREIQGALDRLPGASGNEVQLAAGTYVIREPIFLHRDFQTLRGSGTNTILRLADRANCPVIVLGSPFTQSAHPISFVHVADLFIDGNRRNQQRETWKPAPDGALVNNNGITVWGVNDALVERVTCSRCRSGGLVSAHGNLRMHVLQFEAFDNQFDGLACYQTENSIFSGLALHDNPSAGISLDLAFNHNTISDVKLYGNDLGIFMRDTRDNNFSGVKINHCHNHGVFMAQAGDFTTKGWRLIPGTQCTGNTFSGLVITDCGGKAFLVNDETCKNNTIIDAHFQANSKGDLVQAAPHLVTLSVLK